MSSATSAFADRKVLFAVLLALLAGNVAVLLSYRTFYDVRLRTLVTEQAGLETRRDDARRGAEEAAVSERKLFDTQERLTGFFSETLGKREERIAPLIEEIYRTTREVGLRPDSIAYASKDEPGTDSLTMTFAVSGPYGDVKRLLSELERSRRFLVVEQLSLAGGSENDPNLVSISMTVTNYFRPGSLRPIRTVRDSRARFGTSSAAAASKGSSKR